MAESGLDVRPRYTKTTRPDGGSPVASSQCSGGATSAFTLVEMMVVILIIILLFSLLFTAGSGMFERARKVQARNDVTQIVTAVTAYYTEYGKYPVTVTDNTTDAYFGSGTPPAGCTSYTSNDKLLNVLRNITSDSNAVALNPRQIVFISPRSAQPGTLPRGGVSQTAGTAGQYMDPWGSQYNVAIDTTYNNQIGTANPYSDTDGSAGENPVRQGVIAYSFGKNGALGGAARLNTSFVDELGTAGTFKGSSDILSWQ
jgi:type II secretory pathway pseudopilin PulG